MAKAVRISLANKCQLLFGAAVVLILTSALAVVWLRMERLVQRVPLERAEVYAEVYLADLTQLGGALTPPGAGMGARPDVDLTLDLLSRNELALIPEEDTFLRAAVERFKAHLEVDHDFTSAVDADGKLYFRYVRAVRKSDIARSSLSNQQPSPLVETAIGDELERVLVIHLRDSEAANQQAINRIYILAAGVFAGLLAIGVFWFITTRIILSPVRILRGYAAKVSEGDLAVRSDINTGDEYEDLSNMFNTMLGGLKDKQDQLRQINKSLDLKLGELAESNVALYEANKVKGEFLANVSHELRTPLNSIVGFAEVLQETLADRTGPMDEKRKRYAANIIASSRRLLDLINDLLDLAKIEAGRMDVHVTPTSVSDLCEGLVALMKPQAEKAKIALRLQIEPGLPIVNSDPGKLQQILFNFLSNAIKFTPEAGTVTLAAAAAPPRPGSDIARVRLSVTDTGPGISDEDQVRIFDKFTQLDPTATRKHAGTGLGLTISKELSQLLHAEIDVDSLPGQGATFSVIVPVTLQPKTAPLMPDAASA